MTETAYKNRDNIIRRSLLKSGQPLSTVEKAAITRVIADVGPLRVDSSAGSLIWWDGEYVNIRAGLIPEIRVREYDVKLTVFDAETPNGKAWGSFPMSVISWGD
jgi:hypothetical protein